MGRSECSFPQGCADGMKSFCSPQSVRAGRVAFPGRIRRERAGFPGGIFLHRADLSGFHTALGTDGCAEGHSGLRLCLYVGAMCIPALLIILLVAGGKSILALSEGSLRRMPAVKLCYAVLFIVFAVFSLYMLI